LVGAAPAAVFSPEHAGVPSVPLLEEEEEEVLVVPELVVLELELVLLVVPELVVLELELVLLVVPELVVLELEPGEVPPAPPVWTAGSLEPHRAVARHVAARTRVRTGDRIVRVMAVKLLVCDVISLVRPPRRPSSSGRRFRSLSSGTTTFNQSLLVARRGADAMH
jgi:hypothetical protein